MSEPGDLLGGHYRVLDVLSGGMGEGLICELIEDVRPQVENDEAAQDKTRRPLPLALKTFQRRYFFDNAVRQSFIREASTWLRLSGLPHILPVLGIEQIGDRPFLQMPVV